MASIDEIRPLQPNRLIDLVAAAGHDVGDWKKFKGGVRRQATNPKYCYEWAFIQQGRAAILNLWFDELVCDRGTIFQQLNYRQFARELPQSAARGLWVRRATVMDRAVALSEAKAMPVRIIVSDGDRREITKNPSKASTVKKRFLDPVPWLVTFYDHQTGQCTITRGAPPPAVDDQFSNFTGERSSLARRMTTTSQFVRDMEVRNRVRSRSQGYCEYCSAIGFTTTSGALYVETHHIDSLADGGPDNEANMIALCPTDHRRAHYDKEAHSLRREFKSIVEAKVKIRR